MTMGNTRFVHFGTSLLPLTLVLSSAAGMRAQTVMRPSGPGGMVHTFNTDEAILESQEVRKDLACTVEPIKASLGFDLRYHTGYEVTVPLRELAGAENVLTMIYRVTWDKDKQHRVYFSQRINVPKIEEDAKGDAYL